MMGADIITLSTSSRSFTQAPVDLQSIRLAHALHGLGEAVGADVGTRADVLAKLDQLTAPTRE